MVQSFINDPKQNFDKFIEKQIHINAAKLK